MTNKTAVMHEVNYELICNSVELVKCIMFECKLLTTSNQNTADKSCGFFDLTIDYVGL